MKTEVQLAAARKSQAAERKRCMRDVCAPRGYRLEKLGRYCAGWAGRGKAQDVKSAQARYLTCLHAENPPSHSKKACEG